jgi:hypothetical protein
MRASKLVLTTFVISIPIALVSIDASSQVKGAAKPVVRVEPSETPGTIQKWRTIRTRWLELPVPAGWRLVRKCIDGDDARRILWSYESPRRNFKLWMIVRNDQPLPFKKLANRYWRHAQHRSQARDFQTLKEEIDVGEGKETFMAVGSAEMRRFEKVHSYLITGLLRRLKRHKKLFSATIAAEGAVLDELMPLASALMDKIKVLDGKSPAAKKPPAKPGPMPKKPGTPQKGAPTKKAR